MTVEFTAGKGVQLPYPHYKGRNKKSYRIKEDIVKKKIGIDTERSRLVYAYYSIFVEQR